MLVVVVVRFVVTIWFSVKVHGHYLLLACCKIQPFAVSNVGLLVVRLPFDFSLFSPLLKIRSHSMALSVDVRLHGRSLLLCGSDAMRDIQLGWHCLVHLACWLLFLHLRGQSRTPGAQIFVNARSKPSRLSEAL